MTAADYIQHVRAQLNRAAARAGLVWGLLLGVVVTLLAGLGCVWRGYPVLGWCYALGIAVFGITAVVIFLRRRKSPDEAAAFADSHFHLKDVLTSDLHFRENGRSDGFFALVSAQADQLAAKAGEQSLGLPWPRRILALAVILLGATAMLSLRRPSPEIERRWEQERLTAERSKVANQELKRQMEQLAEFLDESDRELLNEAELKRWASELRETRDLKEAMRQYALLERRLQEAAQRLSQRENEELLRQAGEAVARDPQNRSLGRQLEEKNFDLAAQQLAAMRPEADGGDPEGSREKNGQLRSAAQRMGEAARDASRRNNNGSARTGEQTQDTLSQTMQSLDEAMRELDQALRQSEREKKNQTGQSQPDTQSRQQAQQQQQKAQQQLQSMTRQLTKAARSRTLAERLQQMARSASQRQHAMNNSQNSSNAGEQNNTGGKAGKGTVESRREGADPLPSSSQVLQASGIKGEGPSEKSIESSDSGEGGGAVRAGSHEREYQRQAESFIRREDVPAEVREGVKTYFKTIHAPRPEPAAPSDPLPEPPLPKTSPGPKKGIG